MKELIENICTIVDECGVDSCDIDMLVRMNENFINCAKCIFKYTDKDLGGCPCKCIEDDENILR